MAEPTSEGFVTWMNNHSDGVLRAKDLTNDQLALVDALIDYRRKHFMMGRRRGRTTVVNLVQEYFTWCGQKRTGREI